ncbi:TolB family protein [Kitasatospora sp. NBC_01539]|uniref:TolB family protein n=1 Tax=Kitasatospora sp. NBC_01539 TaxID=2903577 RepID=UPI003860137D
MSARTRLRTAAIALALVATAGSSALLTACGPVADAGSKAAPAVPATPAARSASPGSAGTAAPVAPVGLASATPSTAAPGTAAPGTAPAVVNGTAHSALTISNGTRYVLMNGTSVDFGTVVRDLAWSPDGAKAAFITGTGDLATANPDGSGRVVVAKNPGGQTWSHPTWQVAPAAGEYQLPAKNNLIFAAAKDGVTRLKRVTATAAGAIPADLALGTYSDENAKPLPETGNTWPSAGGTYGTAVYANTGTGEVYIRDEYLRQQGSALTPGSQPALSPDGEDIVFVRAVDGHDHIFALTDHGAHSKDLTPHATTDYTEPAFSPDGRTIAVRTPSGIATLPADGSAAPTVVSGYPGLPAYRGGHR